MQRFLFSILALMVIAFASNAQALKPVKWTYAVERVSKDEAVLVFTATIEKGWHIYSQFTPDGGPLPTVFTFDQEECYEVVGKPGEPAAHEAYDSTFEVKVLTLDGAPVFRQNIKLHEGVCTIKGRIDGQVCKDVCIMFGDVFTFNIKEDEGDSTH